jgi:hypothetical protein
MNKEKFIIACESAFEQLMIYSKEIAPELLEEKMMEGHWSFKEMAIHFDFWNTIIIRALDELNAGREFDWQPYWNMDEQNALQIEKRRHNPVKRILNELCISQTALMEAVKRVSNEQLENGGMTGKMLNLVPEHYHHHRMIVEEWKKGLQK